MKLDNVFYINLEPRQDRKQLIEQELRDLGWGYERYNAISNPIGIVGCGQSHLDVITKAKERDLDYVVVVEDDALFLHKDFINSQIQKVFESDLEYDVLLLAGNVRNPIVKNTDIEGIDNVYQVRICWAATCYIVKKHYYDKLIDNFKEGIDLLTKTKDVEKYACDSWWMRLQEKDKWLIILPRTISQRADYSDIENKYVDYRHLMCDI